MSNEISRADRHIAFNDNVRLHNRVITDYRLRPDRGERTDLDIGTNLRAGIDKSCRMNFQSTPASLKLK